jgi:peptidoglycan/LPS O-acetylase OafA/YrhL
VSSTEVGDSRAGSFTLGYRPAFDGIRGIGVLIIMGAHSFIESLAPIGLVALQTFFVLSGFLITVLLVREWQRHGTISLKNFYIRRALRLLPAVVAFLGIATAVVALTFPQALVREHYRAAAAALFYFYNWAFIGGWVSQANIIGHCWSLAVEEQFYLVWPLVLILLLRLPMHRNWKLAVVACAAFASMAARAILIRDPATNPWHVQIGSDMHADSLLLGCLIGMAACWNLLPASQRALALVKSLGLLSFVLLVAYGGLIAYWNVPYRNAFEAIGGQGMRVLAIGFMFLALLIAPSLLACRILEAPLIVWFGRRSYSIYLWHLGISAYLQIMLWPRPAIAVASGALAIVIAAASFRWLEAPFLRKKVRYSSEPAAALAPLAQTAGVQHPDPASVHRAPGVPQG